jgi:hypothetical protein
MAIKAIAQLRGNATVVDGDIVMDLYMKVIGGDDGVLTFSAAPNGFTEAAIAAWAKDYMNTHWNANIGLLDTVKIVSGVGGLL